MKPWLFIFIGLLLSVSKSSAQADTLISIANSYFDAMSAKNYDKAFTYIDSSVAKRMTPEIIEEAWRGLLGFAGDFIKTTGLRSDTADSLSFVYIGCEFKKAKFDLRMTMRNHKITGFYVVPSRSVSYSYKNPDYINLDAIEAQKFYLKTQEFKLPAQLTLPKNKKNIPVVILVHGSGPHDWDQSIGPNKIFRDLGLGLASAGIATIRYDKRTFAQPEKLEIYGDTFNIMHESGEDVISAIAYAKTIKEIDSTKIYVLGHSLGAMLAPRIASLVPNLKGIIMLAGNARPLEDLIMEQVNYLHSMARGQEANEKIERIKQQVRQVKSQTLSLKTPKEDLPIGIPASYWLDLRDYQQQKVAKSLSCRALILQGERDYQVTMKDFKLWQKAFQKNESALLISYKTLNHLFMEGSGKSLPEEYEMPGNIPAYIINDISNWVLNE